MKKNIFTILVVLVFALNISAQTWSPLGSGLTGFSNSHAAALTVYNNQLIVGGDFTIAGGVNANRIARWNGTNWEPLGSGMDAWVGSLIVYNNELIAGGQFTTAGGVNANRIAKWNGTNWSPLGYGMDGPVYSLIIYDNQLIAGGYFSPLGHIAKWNGSNWESIGSMNNTVRDLTIYNNELIAGGDFSTCGGSEMTFYIAKWNGTIWSPLGSGMGGGYFPNVTTLTAHDGLIASGNFTTAGGISAMNIAKWNGSNWSSFGGGMNNLVNDFCVYNNQLIAGGFFTTAGGISAMYIAKWNGISWSTLASGMNGYVNALTVFNNGLFAGGDFSTAGGITVNRIAKWFSPFGIKQISTVIPEKFSLSQNYPNPFNPKTIIKFDLPKNSYVSLRIFDILGREVETLVDEQLKSGTYQADWDGSSYASGVYYYSLTTESFKETKKMMLVK